MKLSVPLGVSLILIWALGYPIGALGLRVLPPFELLALRFLLSGAVMVVLALASRAKWPRGRQLGHTIVAGLLIQAVQFICVYAGMANGVPAAVSALVIAMNPVLTTVLGAFVFGERLTRLRVLALVLGVAAVVASLGSRVLASGGVDGATVLTVIGLLGLAAGGVYQQRFVKGVDVRAGTAVQLATAAVPTTVIALCLPMHVSNVGQAVWVLAVMVLVSSALGSLLLFRALHTAGATKTTVIFTVIPAVSALLSWAMLGQQPTVGVLVGLVLGAVATVLGNRAGTGSSAKVTEVTEVTSSASTIRTAVEEQPVVK